MKKIKMLAVVMMAVLALNFLSGFATRGTSNGNGSRSSKTRVVSTMKGNVVIPANPQRIADISGSSEDLLILGLTPVATANTDAYKTTEFPMYIKDKLKTSKIVGFSMMDTMNVEGILNTSPDLIIMSERQSKIYDQLKAIAPVIMLKDYANDWKTQLLDLSKLLNKQDKAQKWIHEYDKKAMINRALIVNKNGKQSYLTVLASSGKFYIFSDAGIGSMLYKDMKLPRPENLPKQDSISLPVVNLEGLAQIDADNIIMIATENDKNNLQSSSVWKNMRAVKNDKVVMLESSPYFNQGYNPIGRMLLLDVIKEKLLMSRIQN